MTFRLENLEVEVENLKENRKDKLELEAFSTIHRRGPFHRVQQ